MLKNRSDDEIEMQNEEFNVRLSRLEPKFNQIIASIESQIKNLKLEDPLLKYKLFLENFLYKINTLKQERLGGYYFLHVAPTKLGDKVIDRTIPVINGIKNLINQCNLLAPKK